MRNHRGWKMTCVAALVAAGGCQTHPSTHPAPEGGTGSTQPASPPTHAATAAPAPATPPPSQGNGKISDLSASDLHDVLAELDNGHHDKMKLAFWVSTPLRSADPVFKTFYKEMGAQQKELATELENWAKSRHVDITYHEGTDTFGKAQTIMSKRQEKTVRADNKDDFGRDMLIDEFQDYEFTVSLIQALLPSVHDAALRTYLEHSLHVNEAASLQLQGLFKRYKFTG